MEKIRVFIEALFNNKRFNIIAGGIIAAMVLIAYSNTFTASFHFDDNPSIIENASIRHVTFDNIAQILRGVRPVIYLSIMMNYALSGLNVIGWHIFNIGIHIANSIFVYLLVLRTLLLPVFGKRYDGNAKWMALFAALLFGVHPIQTESVTYIISRTELLATFFYLATFLLFIKGAPTGKFGYAMGLLFTSYLAMGSKEWAVTLPALLILYDFLFIAEGKMRPLLSRWYFFAMTAIPWVQVYNTLNLTAKGGQAGIGFDVVSPTGISPVSYLLTSFNVIWTYIRLLVLPIGQNLDYDYPIAKTLFEIPTMLSFLGHFVVVSAAFWLYKKKGMLLVPFGLAWFYIGLSPVQSFVPIIDVIFEHRLYMPSIGMFLAFIVAYEGFIVWWDAKKMPQKGMVG
jgi:protein O-mannosyl-transferase